MSLPHFDDWTIDRWKLEPHLHGLEMDDPPAVEVAPPLGKHLTLAHSVPAVLWLTAAMVFG